MFPENQDDTTGKVQFTFLFLNVINVWDKGCRILYVKSDYAIYMG